MSKDPAFLFYHQDFFSGVSDMTNEEIGAYILCLCVQASKGGITEKHMFIICKTQEVHELIKSKFVFNDAIKLLENLRLKSEIEKRKKYSESRATNRKGKTKDAKSSNNTSLSYVNHMEDENEIEIKDEINVSKVMKVLKGEKLKTSLPWDTESFNAQWQLWKTYKAKEHGFKYKTNQSEQAALVDLFEMSAGDERRATAIINQSITNGWKGLFLLKVDKTPKLNSNEFTALTTAIRQANPHI